MWAMIPMLRVRASGNSRIRDDAIRGNLSSTGARQARPERTAELPAVVSESAVALRHLVHVLTTLHGGADAVRCVEDLVGQAVGHGLLAALAREIDEPADRQRVGPA